MSFFKYPMYDIPEATADSDAGTGDHVLTAFVNTAEYEAEEKSLLQKILGTTKLGKQQINIQTYDRMNIDSVHLDDQNKNLVLSFGLNSLELGVQVDNTKYQMIHVGALSLLFLDPLPVIKTDANLKKALWVNLKTYFNL